MHGDPIETISRTRREFLTSAASGLGGLALSAALAADTPLGSRQASEATANNVNPLAPKPGHFAARAKSCIFIFMEGAPSQADLFDPKP